MMDTDSPTPNTQATIVTQSSAVALRVIAHLEINRRTTNVVATMTNTRVTTNTVGPRSGNTSMVKRSLNGFELVGPLSRWRS